MDLKQLECFVALSSELHFSRAAEKLYMTQPSLSQQIKNLETEMGTPLFDRMGKKTALTEAGKILLTHSENIFHEMEQAKAAINDLNVLQRGKLTIGSLLTCVHYLLPPSILEMKKMYPNIELSVLGLRTGEIREKLLDNELDLGITFLPVDDDELDAIPLMIEDLSLAVPPSHPLAKIDTVEMRDLEGMPMILMAEGYFLRKMIDDTFMDLGIHPNPVLEMTTLESIIQMVSENVGITILPKPYLQYLNHEKVKHVNLIKPTPEREIGIIYRKDKFMCAATKTFINQLTKAGVSLTQK